MSKQTIILAIAAFAIGGILMTVLLRSYDSKDTVPLAETTITGEVQDGPPKIPPSTPPSGKKMAFSEFIKQGGAYTCTVNQSVRGVEFNVAIHINGEMIRGEYSTNREGRTTDHILIVRDGYAYTWTPSSRIGSKAKVEAVREDRNAPASPSASVFYSFNAEDIDEYDCQPWTADPSLFVIPKDVTWVEDLIGI